MIYGKQIVDDAKSGGVAFLVDLLRGKDDLPREVRDYLADIVAKKEKVKHAKLPLFTFFDVLVILVTWARYNDPDLIQQARDQKRKNLLGPKRAIADLVTYFEKNNKKVSVGIIKDVIARRKTYAGLFEFEYKDFYTFTLKPVNSDEKEKPSVSP